MFQEAQYKANFRARRRFELRLRALASNTLRKYGFCEADLWSEVESVAASRLLQGLQSIGDDRSRRQGKQGDVDAWLWEDEAPDFVALMQDQIARLNVGADASERECVQRVGERLLGPDHLPRVQEVLGCLIPRDLHWRFDGKKPRGKVSSGFGTAGVYMYAGQWRVDVAEEQELFDGRLLKGMLEFFLLVLRRVCQKLDLPVAIGSHKLGKAVSVAEDSFALRLMVQGWEQWQDMTRALRQAKQFLVPVVLDDARVQRKCLLVHLSAGDGDGEDSLLTRADSLRVRVSDHVGRKALAQGLAVKVVGLLQAADVSSRVRKVEVVLEPDFPECDMDYDVGLAVLGLLVGRVVALDGRPGLDVTSSTFTQKVGSALKSCFAYLRSEAGCQGHRDALKVLDDSGRCRHMLQLLCGVGGEGVDSSMAPVQPVGVV